MKKSNFFALIMGTIGGVFFALGMCMALVQEWNMRSEGIISGAIGIVVLMVTLFIWRRMEGKTPIKVSGKTVGTVAVGVSGSLLFGVGMCLCMLLSQFVIGVAVGLIGIVTLLMLIPLTKGLK